MGDAGEGLIDADARIQERMEELERDAHADEEEGRAGPRESARVRVAAARARPSWSASSRRRSTSGRRTQLRQAIDEVTRRMSEMSAAFQ